MIQFQSHGSCSRRFAFRQERIDRSIGAKTVNRLASGSGMAALLASLEPLPGVELPKRALHSSGDDGPFKGRAQIDPAAGLLRLAGRNDDLNDMQGMFGRKQ